ncbi:M50 family metallopeptidase [Actinokineospora sp. PR83]|uniref:M50 family metallopeptidase n=1 Tax=Actinokineospora sp. PR83 TaxID=2884908 RepID=UPI001F1BF44A|nr:M50 family metallopeptidase [Actinokineospora sp. PR83]MCG8920295.1 M50 family metallopeptidase [Actinokineospora sp. PR83]
MLTATTPAPSPTLVVISGVIAALISAVTLVPRTSRVRRAVHSLNVLGTIVHEGGHAAVSCLTGGGAHVIQIHTAGSGAAHVWAQTRWSAVATQAAGYAAPALAGLGAAALLAGGHVPAVLAATIVAMVAVLLLTRDVFSAGCVAGIAALAALVLWRGGVVVQQWVAYTETWMLLCSEITAVAHLGVRRIRGHETADDADALAELTGLPWPVWITGWLTVIGWALWTAVPLLWP